MKLLKLKKLITCLFVGGMSFLFCACGEKPLVETVQIPDCGWSIGKYEVTQAQYAKVMKKSSFKECLKEKMLKALNEKELTMAERAEHEAKMNKGLESEEVGIFLEIIYL